MSTRKIPLRILITPNYAAPYDQRMVNGLARGFQTIGQQAYAQPAPMSAVELAAKCRELSIDVVIQVNRTRDPDIALPPKARHISWFQDVFPETLNGFADGFRDSDILYALGDPVVLGLNLPLPCRVGSLVSGVDQEVIDYRKKSALGSVDFSLCGFIPPPLPKRRSFWRYLRPGNVRYNTTEIMVDTVHTQYRPLRGELDIHELASAIRRSTNPGQSSRWGIKRRLRRWLSRLGRPAAAQPAAGTHAISLFEKSISYFTREYPRLLDRVALIEGVLQVSDSLELYGPGWETHPKFRPYAKGMIDSQDGLLEVYNRSRINLANNTHGLGLHSRTLECMAVGGFIFMHESPHDHKPGGMLTSFSPGVHFGSYTPENMGDEARRWLKEEKKRMQAGIQAAEVVRQQHCWHHRAQQIIDDLGR